MSRILLSNGDLSVGLDGVGQVKEVYFPGGGVSNHVGSGNIRHKIGVYVDGAIHWLDDGTWRVEQKYYPGSLVGQTIANNRWLGIRLEIQDFVDSELNVLSRNASVVNLTSRHKHIKLFFHQAFIMGGDNRATDTVQYIPAGSSSSFRGDAIVHYGMGVAAAFTVHDANGHSFTDYSVGKFGENDGTMYDGVWCDAADGALSKNPTDNGTVDSIMSISLSIDENDSARIGYELALDDSPKMALTTLSHFEREGAKARLDKTSEHYKNWLGASYAKIRSAVPVDYRWSVVDALATLRANTSTKGAIITGLGIDGRTPVVESARASVIANVLSNVSLEVDSARIFNFLSTASGGALLYPSYLSSGAVAPDNYHYRADRLDAAVAEPVNLSDTAITLYCLGQCVKRGLASKQLINEWKKLWDHFGLKLADALADNIDITTKLPKASWHPRDKHRLTKVSDVAWAYGAFMMAADVCDALKDLDGVIKYSAIADDIAANSDKLWNETRGYYYRGFSRTDEDYAYDGAIETTALLACRITGLMPDYYDVAEKTLASQHINNNGTYVRGERDIATDSSSLADIMALSLAMGEYNSSSLDKLISACNKMLYSVNALASTPNAVANMPLLRAIFIESNINS